LPLFFKTATKGNYFMSLKDQLWRAVSGTQASEPITWQKLSEPEKDRVAKRGLYGFFAAAIVVSGTIAVQSVKEITPEGCPIMLFPEQLLAETNECRIGREALTEKRCAQDTGIRSTPAPLL
jgi:hypothetical protein